MLSYILLANIWALLFWIAYRIGFKNSQAFLAAKIYIVLSILGIALLPLMDFENVFFADFLPQEVTVLNIVTIDNQALELWRKNNNTSIFTLHNAYSVSIFIMLGMYIIRLWRMHSKLQKFPTSIIDGIATKRNTQLGPGSFFNTIILPDAQIHKAVWLHEQAHIQHRHYAQRVFMTLIQIIAFPIVFMHLFKKEWMLLNEFQADFYANNHCEDYPYQLLNATFQTQQFNPLQLFIHHPIKQRIAMITHSKKPHYIVALTAFIILAGSGTVLQSQVKAKVKEVPTVSPTPTVSQSPEILYKQPPPPGPGTVKHAIVNKGNDPSFPVEQKVKYKGNLNEDIGKYLEYPDLEVAERVNGRLHVQFVVSAEGKTEDVKVLGKGLGAVYNNAAITAVKKLTDWDPASENGKAVKSIVVLPISFVSNDEEESTEE